MADQEPKQTVEKLPRRDFFKRTFAVGSRSRTAAEEAPGSSAKDNIPVEPNTTEEAKTVKLPRKQYPERDALRQISYGLYVLTTCHETNLNAISCNWVTQISFSPLLVLVAVEKKSYSHQLLQEGGAFGLNLLDKDQIHLARQMAVPRRHNPHKLAGVPYHLGKTGVPLLDDALAWLECEVRQSLDGGGDHTLFIGEVVDGGVIRRAEPLTLLTSGLRYK